MWINPWKSVLCFYFCAVVCRAIHRYDSTLYSYPSRVATTTSRYNLNSDVKLRHSKFENLARVNSKIDSMNSFKSTNSKHKLRHNKWHDLTTTTTTTENSLFNNYGDLEDESEDDDDYSNDFQSLDDEYDEDIDGDSTLFDEEEDNSDDWQAEEPTEKPTYKPISSFSEYKWQILGTREKVEDTRKHLTPTIEQINIQLAREHYLRVRQEGSCEKPKPRVVYVQNEHPNSNRKYTPHCTVLHRCSEDTGCCNHGSYRCQFKTRELVHLYFYARTVGETDSKVVKLTFYNHTACECKDINKNETDVISVKPSHLGNAFKLATNALYHHTPENLRGCKCPEAYKSKPSYTLKCVCDCESSNEACGLFKKGVEHFSYKDRKCISENQCGAPTCEYGIYDRERGKCPTRQEKLEMYRRLPVH